MRNIADTFAYDFSKRLLAHNSQRYAAMLPAPLPLAM
jgi:hypothetical protein